VPRISAQMASGANVLAAFLDMIAQPEGTSL
jgi:hypothetical protein